jgi:hypothetical protein
VVRLGSGDGPLSVRGCPSTVKSAPRFLSKMAFSHSRPWSLCTPSGQKPRARQEPARTGRGPSPARCGAAVAMIRKIRGMILAVHGGGN